MKEGGSVCVLALGLETLHHTHTCAYVVACLVAWRHLCRRRSSSQEAAEKPGLGAKGTKVVPWCHESEGGGEVGVRWGWG